MKALATCLLILALWEARAFSSGMAVQTTQEVVTRDTPATFTAKTNLVSMPVVIRDKNGRAVDNLRRENFQLFDRGKPQAISSFPIVKTPDARGLYVNPAPLNDTKIPAELTLAAVSSASFLLSKPKRTLSLKRAAVLPSGSRAKPTRRPTFTSPKTLSAWMSPWTFQAPPSGASDTGGHKAIPQITFEVLP